MIIFSYFHISAFVIHILFTCSINSIHQSVKCNKIVFNAQISVLLSLPLLL
jgi:hypothetical protein